MKLVATLLIGLLAGCVQAAPASAASVCARYGTVDGPGGYYQNNVWGQDEVQCVSTSGTTSQVTSSGATLPTNGHPASFPSYVTGSHWGHSGPNVGLPAQLSKITSIPTSWYAQANKSDGMTPLPGAYDVATEFWTNSTPTTTGQPDGSEIMVWLNYRGVQPAGAKVGQISLAGALWDVWYGDFGWKYTAYVRVGAADRLVGDTSVFLRDAIARGYANPAHYLISQETGFEIWQGGTGLALTGYSVQYKLG